MAVKILGEERERRKGTPTHAVRVDEKWGYVDKAGRWVIPPSFTHAERFWHGLASVAFGAGRWGYVDKGGSVVWQNKSE